ncbi:GNAT family N-acetyltransferase [Reichenbachiella agarivorans]|uniref:GNAT family N-acetyltransferase n=1 Tax=Reichenbachiella agarivorans TaxID=2979464 RepID=A0ABY6CR26_9BACT|nr:GNAT family N-acetyltransferase [Reichenbachiella agarivorans]UXP31828.1 GNAT family N-acetyltransferase [Reichenbachiella agarivorans]
MIQLIRTDSNNADFIALVNQLDADLAIRDGDDHDFYHQYNHIDQIKHAIVAKIDDQSVGCGAIKEYDPKVMEVKRMYVLPSHRGKRIAIQILTALEDWARELGYQKCVLETGKAQPEAIALYQKCNYAVIPNYGQYVGVDNSICFEKKLN